MKLFYEGGPLFMGILTGILVIMIAWAIYHFLPVLLKKEIDSSNIKSRLRYIKTIGSFAMVTGLLGQLIGLIQIFDIIERMGDISPSIVSGGLKVSLIPTVYGILIFLFSLLLWIAVDFVASNKSK
ncbi:MAG: MotA/TolQ/ExbB proton channel family protein [Prolixibacteraceae bacterium]|nr:MotA/TolQ/ExbB proton channel family protein [Prolixibacteraceae bacterium]